jgi:hypothetical protein
MNKRIILKNAAGFEITYEYRFNRTLLMFTNFNPMKHSEFADSLQDLCPEIKNVEKLIRYDEQSGAIIITMHVGYNHQVANQQLYNSFHQFFTSTSQEWKTIV